MRGLARLGTLGISLLLTGGALSAAGAAAAAAASGPPTAPPPPSGFRAQSQAWDSPRHGWVLGVAPCGTTTCTAVVTTSDAGAHWSVVGAPAAPLAPPGEPGVTELIFADDLHGWAYGPSLYQTVDGGRHWRSEAIPGGGQQVLSLATGGGSVYAVVSSCTLGDGTIGCTTPTTVWRTGVQGGAWQQVPVTLPVTLDAFVAAEGRAAYVVSPGQGAPDVLEATVDGHTWSARTSPCDPAQDLSLADVVALPSDRVDLLCVGDAGFHKAVKQVFGSTDAAQTVVSAGQPSVSGIRSALAATPDGKTLAVTSFSDGSWIYLNTSGTTWITPVNRTTDQAGWNDPVFTTNTTGYVIYNPATNPAPLGTGVLLTTDNGGRNWTPVYFR